MPIILLLIGKKRRKKKKKTLFMRFLWLIEQSAGCAVVIANSPIYRQRGLKNRFQSNISLSLSLWPIVWWLRRNQQQTRTEKKNFFLEKMWPIKVWFSFVIRSRWQTQATAPNQQERSKRNSEKKTHTRTYERTASIHLWEPEQAAAAPKTQQAKTFYYSSFYNKMWINKHKFEWIIFFCSFGSFHFVHKPEATIKYTCCKQRKRERAKKIWRRRK